MEARAQSLQTKVRAQDDLEMDQRTFTMPVAGHSVSQLKDRTVTVFTALDCFCSTTEPLKSVQLIATLDKTAIELSKDLKKAVLGNNTVRYHNFM